MGKLPWYFDYFIHSCRYNPTVNFIIITDDMEDKKLLPPNILILHKTLDEINNIASTKLGFQVKIKSGYKLCDFKPAYGLLFEDLLAPYDFWGHADIDIIFGNIRNFITDSTLDNYDLIAVRHDFLTGYFLLFRNNEKLKWLFSHSRDYERVFRDEIHYCFDETNFHFQDFEAKMHYSQIQSDVESMTHVAKRLDEHKYIRAYFDYHVIEGAYGKLCWDNGKLMYKNKFEAILYHLIMFKTIYFPKKTAETIPDKFNISRTRIYKPRNINR